MATRWYQPRIIKTSGSSCYSYVKHLISHSMSDTSASSDVPSVARSTILMSWTYSFQYWSNSHPSRNFVFLASSQLGWNRSRSCRAPWPIQNPHRRSVYNPFVNLRCAKLPGNRAATLYYSFLFSLKSKNWSYSKSAVPGQNSPSHRRILGLLDSWRLPTVLSCLRSKNLFWRTTQSSSFLYSHPLQDRSFRSIATSAMKRLGKLRTSHHSWDPWAIPSLISHSQSVNLISVSRHQSNFSLVSWPTYPQIQIMTPGTLISFWN